MLFSTDDENCGSSYGLCPNKDDLNISALAIGISVIGAIIGIIICLTCYMHGKRRRERQQRSRNSRANSNVHRVPNPHYQQNRPAPSSQLFQNMYESPPPSYEAATANLPSVHQPPSAPPITPTIQESFENNV